MATVLSAQGLSKEFRGFRAVDDVDLEVPEGGVHALVGPNGTGKTTLFNLLTGFLKPTEGRITLGTHELSGRRPEQIARLGVARSFQITSLFTELTVMENLRLAAQVLERVGQWFLPVHRSLQAARKTDEMLERFRLTAKAGELAGNLSHGEQRRLEIAVCLASEPRILLLDEPTQGMSHGDTADTAALVRSLAQGVTVLLIEHDIGLVMDLSDHVVVMHQGRKLAEGPPATVRADPAVQAAYFGHA